MCNREVGEFGRPHRTIPLSGRPRAKLRPMEFEIPHIDPPHDLELDREHHLKLTWENGRVATFALEPLRTNCPCAACRGLREQGKPAYPTPGAPQPLTAVNAELVGNWGITIAWNDGHDTGIFAWGMLSEWARLGTPGTSETI